MQEWRKSDTSSIVSVFSKQNQKHNSKSVRNGLNCALIWHFLHVQQSEHLMNLQFVALEMVALKTDTRPVTTWSRLPTSKCDEGMLYAVLFVLLGCRAGCLLVVFNCAARSTQPGSIHPVPGCDPYFMYCWCILIVWIVLGAMYRRCLFAHSEEVVSLSLSAALSAFHLFQGFGYVYVSFSLAGCHGNIAQLASTTPRACLGTLIRSMACSHTLCRGGGCSVTEPLFRTV